MNPGHYNFTWHTYSAHLRDMMKELMMNYDFTDVTLVTEDRKHIRAHKNILSTSSPVFKAIVKLDLNAKSIIFLRGINFSELESIMQFIYLGEAIFNEERMNEFLAVAKLLEIKELCNAKTETNNDCEPSLSSNNIDDDDEASTNNPVSSSNNTRGKSMRSSHLINQASKDLR